MPIFLEILESNMNSYDDQYMETMRHSFAHILAQAVLRLYPGAKLGIGPAIPEGFYYEFDLPAKISVEELPQIEAEMKKIISEAQPFKQITITRQQAFDMLMQLGQVYKTELLQQVPDEEISFYKTGEEFIDLCRGPHVNHTGQLKVFKLIGINESNWLADAERPLMQRITGVAFAGKKELERYLQQQEELRLNDHAKLGKEIEIFSTDPDKVGHSLHVLLQNGILLKQRLEQRLMQELMEHDYYFVQSPELISTHSLKKARIIDYKPEQLLGSIKLQDQDYVLKPGPESIHYEIFQQKTRSYKELPLRLAEFSVNYVRSNALTNHRLTNQLRYTSLTSTTFVNEKQVIADLTETIHLMLEIIKMLGFTDYKLEVLLPYHNRVGHYLGDEQSWKDSIEIIERALAGPKLVARTHEGEAPFNGPELSIIVKDVFKRDWKLCSIIPDLISAEIYNLRYISNSGEQLLPIILHKQFLVSMEGLIALLIENNGGSFPIWMAPVQSLVIPISQKFNHYATEILNTLKKAKIRARIDNRDETLQAKIREAELQRTPFMLIVGEKEVNTRSVSVRPRSGQDLGLMRIEEFLNLISKEDKIG